MKYIKNLHYYRYLYTKGTDETFFPASKCQVLLLTVAFNNTEFVDLQISLLKKYFEDDFTHCVIDNSTQLSLRKEIKEVCLQHGVSYFGAPKSPFLDQKSHGAAMHWALYNVVRKSKPLFFGFLDHDIFPFKPFSLSGKFHQGIYGRVVNSYTKGGYLEERTKNAPYWSLWAGYCFFEYNRFKKMLPWDLNFLSKHFSGGYFLDTGGGLWDKIYSKTDYPGSLASYRQLRIDSLEGDGDQNQNFEIFDEAWIHFVSLSNWREIKDLKEKKEKLTEILSKTKNEGVDFRSKIL